MCATAQGQLFTQIVGLFTAVFTGIFVNFPEVVAWWKGVSIACRRLPVFQTLDW